jgi:hypothetical protein
MVGFRVGVPQQIIKATGALLGFALVTSSGDLAYAGSGRGEPPVAAHFGVAAVGGSGVIEVVLLAFIFVVAIGAAMRATRFIETYDYDRRTLSWILSEPTDTDDVKRLNAKFKGLLGRDTFVEDTIASLTRLEAAGWARADPRAMDDVLTREIRLIWIWAVTDSGRRVSATSRGRLL